MSKPKNPRSRYTAQALVLATILVAVVAGSGYYFYIYHPNQSSILPPSRIPVVAGENFWGSLVTQVGGTHVEVLSIVTNPNTDPHDYESSADDARAFANAKLIIVNGAGYDEWAGRLIQANGNSDQKILNVADLVGKKSGDNPHFWYSPSFVNQTANQMYLDLVSIDPTDASYYRQQYSSLNASLEKYNVRINSIRQLYEGTRVASTESIFEYLATAAGLNLISPPDFMRAIAEGGDPSVQDRILFEHQLINRTMLGNATMLVYNQQTPSPITVDLRSIAAHNDIPVVAVTETIQPPDVPFQDWMYSQLVQIQNALSYGTGR